MSDLFHPDADQLNAFVEQALPAQERQQTLAHLAECATCRQVVALSFPAMAQVEVVRAPASSSSWYSGWRLAWAGGPLLAAVILLGVFMRSGRVPKSAVTGMDMARSTAPAQPAAPSSAPPTVRSHASHHPRLQPPNPSPAVSTGIMGGVAGAAAASPTVANDTVEILSTERVLPSHLAAVSMVSQGSRRLAIDTASQVFLSADGGQHWQPVPPKWPGRAVRVALTGGSHSATPATPARAMSSLMGPTGTASISGTVTDPTGAFIAGTTVTATDTHKNVLRAVTDPQGQFRLEHLVPGSYRIEAEAPGFVKQSVTAQIATEQQAEVNLTLTVGSASQTVTVEAEAGAVDRLSAAPPQTRQEFELITENGSRWVSQDGLSWSRE